jgi:hypothetical protein
MSPFHFKAMQLEFRGDTRGGAEWDAEWGADCRWRVAEKHLRYFYSNSHFLC